MKFMILTLILFFSGFASVFSSDTIPASKSPQEEQKQADRYFIRGGIGAQGMLSIFYPTDVNAYTKDLYSAIKRKYSGYDSGHEPKEMHWGYGYTLKADIRVFNLLQLEPYWDHFYAFPLEVMFDEAPGGQFGHYAIQATYTFKMSYNEKGVSLLWLPGSKQKNIFLTVGGGFGVLQGEFTESVTGYERVTGTKTSLDDTRTFKGTTNAWHGTVGLTFVPWHYLELELMLNGKYAMIKTLQDDAGVLFTNPYSNDETISLNFSGVDLRVGFKFMFP